MRGCHAGCYVCGTVVPSLKQQLLSQEHKRVQNNFFFSQPETIQRYSLMIESLTPYPMVLHLFITLCPTTTNLFSKEAQEHGTIGPKGCQPWVANQSNKKLGSHKEMLLPFNPDPSWSTTSEITHLTWMCPWHPELSALLVEPRLIPAKCKEYGIYIRVT